MIYLYLETATKRKFHIFCKGENEMRGNVNGLITVDQVGYAVKDKKLAMFKGKGGIFQVINDKNQVVFEGETGIASFDEASGEYVALGDFSSVTTIGNYQIFYNDSYSSTFSISEKPYLDLHNGLLKAYYFLRCGMDLDESYAGPWNHKACHTAKGIVYNEPHRVRDSSGGWHDAGDYGKYTVAAAKALADLLLAYELFPAAFDRQIPIPESDGNIPDILHECRYELEWLFKMQDELTGGVFHKLTTLNFPPLKTMPEEDRANLYFSPISATATGSFAAIMALASRIYQPFDQQFSKRCIESATIAWKWLENHEHDPSFKNPEQIKTGEYGDEIDSDERYWAAAELYKTTGDEIYHKKFKQLLSETELKYELGWADVGGYGTISYLLLNKANTDSHIYESLLQGLVETAEHFLDISQKNQYCISLTNEDYIWGSNMVLLNHAMILLLANHFVNKINYVECAKAHLHYLLGRNPMNLSYVTGFGEHSVMNPHHRPSVADEVTAPIPGLVSGGPNSGLQDDYVKEHLQGEPPAKCFADHEDSYATNEVTIYWNSPAVFVASYFIQG